MAGLDRMRPGLEAQANSCAESGILMSMSDAKWFILDLCKKAQVDCPSPALLKYFASELVRLTLEAHRARAARLGLHKLD